MMQPTHFWDFPDQPKLRPLDRPRHRTIHVQRPMRAPVMIILEISSQEPPQMARVQDDHVVQAVAADTSDESFDVGVLPRSPGSNQYFFNAHMPHPLPKRGAVDTISVSQEIPWRLVLGEGVHDLLHCPRCRGMLSDGNMDDPPAVMSQDQQDEQ